MHARRRRASSAERESERGDNQRVTSTRAYASCDLNLHLDLTQTVFISTWF